MICCWFIYDLFSMSWEEIFWGFIRIYFYIFGFVKGDFLGTRWDFLNWWWIEYIFLWIWVQYKKLDLLQQFKTRVKNTKITSKGSYGLLWQLKPSQEKCRMSMLLHEANENCHNRTYNTYKVAPCFTNNQRVIAFMHCINVVRGKNIMH